MNFKEITCWVGVDWADKKHSYALKKDGKSRSGTFLQKAEAIDVWVSSLRKLADGGKVAVALEQAKGGLIFALMKYDFIVLFPVNPNTFARYREAWSLSGAKDDPTDALLLLELLETHHRKLAAWTPESTEIRLLQRLTDQRVRFVNDLKRIGNKLTSCLKEYYPEVLELFPRIYRDIVAEFLLKYSTLEAAKSASDKELLAFFRANNSGGGEKTLNRHIFDSLPSSGEVSAPKLLAALGTNRAKFSSAEELHCYTGIAPVIERGGNQSWTRWRYKCHKSVRQAFIDWAFLSVRTSFWAEAYYKKARSNGKSHSIAIRALAYKWVRIIFRMWKERKPYDEAYYLKALQKSGSPLLKKFA